jgi:ferric-dicitrate binding protein FerR (iron transport regulator)
VTRKWDPGPIAWIVLRAASLVPAPICCRLEEEWLADLLALDGLLQRVRFAFGCVWAALQMRGERVTVSLSKTAHRNISDEPPTVKPRLELRIPFFKQCARRRAEASAWLARLHRGLRAEEGAQLQAWLKRRSHRECIARLAAENDGPEDLTVLAEICELKSEWLETRYGRTPIINAAAVLISISIASLPFLDVVLPHQRSLTESWGTAYASGRHTVRHVGMPDGTQVALNHETRIALWYTCTTRAALVLQGEATFKVPDDAFRTFRLDAGDRHFASNGGTFNVRLTNGGIVLTVLNGEVTLSAPPVTEPHRRDATLGPTVLKANEVIGIEPGKQSVRTLSQLESQARTAWQRGNAAPRQLRDMGEDMCSAPTPI